MDSKVFVTPDFHYDEHTLNDYLHVYNPKYATFKPRVFEVC